MAEPYRSPPAKQMRRMKTYGLSVRRDRELTYRQVASEPDFVLSCNLAGAVSEARVNLPFIERLDNFSRQKLLPTTNLGALSSTTKKATVIQRQPVVDNSHAPLPLIPPSPTASLH
ncbi:hypothetical protein CIRG_05584 [Coccidioides immitis RMSCC 2394]|uniref:Uncharacterized protein n=1 Tax=Coccidioides immitis RMSCC 2394 TaxID=404692 RepID=A0A0J7B7G7_COCIT|nr:hypothetical protein CIRG_05584 [Coccidioides immitis RMSCC 2394]